VPVEPGTQPRSYARTVTINGQKHILEGATEEDLTKAETALYRAAFGGAPATPAAAAPASQPRNERGQFVEAPQPVTVSAAEKAALSLQLQLGQITMDDYLTKSGAVSDYLAQQGIDPQVLRQVSDAVTGDAASKKWEAAVPTFIANHPEWPGGENREVLSDIISSCTTTDGVSLMDLDPSAALEAAYTYARENDLIKTNPIVVQHDRALAATSVQEIREIYTGGRDIRDSSGMFGR
jgi:hypothetical protein